MNDWYQLEKAEVLSRLETDLEQGLSQAEVQKRLADFDRSPKPSS